MLNQIDYQRLWNQYVQPIMGKTPVAMPPYQQYQNRHTLMLANLRMSTRIDKILIGEAAPSSGKYVYQDALGAYMTAPLAAAELARGQKNPKYPPANQPQSRLRKFANDGFALLDLYPFAIDYSKIRNSLAADAGFQNHIFHNLMIEINAIPKLHNDWDFYMTAPLNTSLGFLNYVEKHQNGQLAARKTVAHPKDAHHTPPFIDKKGQAYPAYTICPVIKKRVARYARITTDIGATGPNAVLLHRAAY